MRTFLYYDNHTGGVGKKSQWQYIIIVASCREAADAKFFDFFEHDPSVRSCPCCGHDFSCYQYDSLAEIIEAYAPKNNVERWLYSGDVIVIHT